MSVATRPGDPSPIPASGRADRRERMAEMDDPAAADEAAEGLVRIPAWAAASHAAYREWQTSEERPTRGRWAWIDGEIVVDMSAEHVDSHLAVKITMSADLYRLVREEDLGQIFPDGLLVSNVEAKVSNEPDLTFASWASIEAGRVRFTPSKSRPDDAIEVVGCPDVVVEIVSPSSEKKDLRDLRLRYHAAGIPEYWLLDARRDAVRFDLLRHAPGGYEAAPKRDGWVESGVFGRRFRLDRERNRVGRWSYELRHEPLPG